MLGALFCLLFFVAPSQGSSLALDYTNSQDLQLREVVLYWNVNIDDKTAEFALEVQHLDRWVALSFLPFRSMIWGDAVILTNGKIDQYDVNGSTMKDIVKDKKQDIISSSFEYTERSTILKFKRLLDTNDKTDQILGCDQSMIVGFAFGTDDKLGYHSKQNRDTSKIELCSTRLEDLEDDISLLQTSCLGQDSCEACTSVGLQECAWCEQTQACLSNCDPCPDEFVYFYPGINLAGTKCDGTSLGVVMRREVHSLSEPELVKFQRALLYMQTNDVYPECVEPSPVDDCEPLQKNAYFRVGGIHSWPGALPPCGNAGSNFCEHGSNAFGPWHRAYMTDFEMRLRLADLSTDTDGDGVPDGDGEVALHYFDWCTPSVVDGGYGSMFTDLTFVDGLSLAPNPLGGFQISQSVQTSRGATNDAQLTQNINNSDLPGRIAELLDNQCSMDFINDIDNRLTGIESVHNSFHVNVGGTMGSPTYAGFNPIFWLNHANVDRLYESWIQCWGMDAVATHFDSLSMFTSNQGSMDYLDAPLYPYSQTSRELFAELTTQQQRYQYDDIKSCNCTDNVGECPSQQYEAQQQECCSWTAGTVCTYGEMCCCGRMMAELTCRCINGEVVCRTDTCEEGCGSSAYEYQVYIPAGRPGRDILQTYTAQRDYESPDSYTNRPPGKTDTYGQFETSNDVDNLIQSGYYVEDTFPAGPGSYVEEICGPTVDIYVSFDPVYEPYYEERYPPFTYNEIDGYNPIDYNCDVYVDDQSPTDPKDPDYRPINLSGVYQFRPPPPGTNYTEYYVGPRSRAIITSGDGYDVVVLALQQVYARSPREQLVDGSGDGWNDTTGTAYPIVVTCDDFAVPPTYESNEERTYTYMYDGMRMNGVTYYEPSPRDNDADPFKDGYWTQTSDTSRPPSYPVNYGCEGQVEYSGGEFNESPEDCQLHCSTFYDSQTRPNIYAEYYEFDVPRCLCLSSCQYVRPPDAYGVPGLGPTVYEYSPNDECCQTYTVSGTTTEPGYYTIRTEYGKTPDPVYRPTPPDPCVPVGGYLVYGYEECRYVQFACPKGYALWESPRCGCGCIPEETGTPTYDDTPVRNQLDANKALGADANTKLDLLLTYVTPEQCYEPNCCVEAHLYNHDSTDCLTSVPTFCSDSATEFEDCYCCDLGKHDKMTTGECACRSDCICGGSQCHSKYLECCNAAPDAPCDHVHVQVEAGSAHPRDINGVYCDLGTGPFSLSHYRSVAHNAPNDEQWTLEYRELTTTSGLMSGWVIDNNPEYPFIGSFWVTAQAELVDMSNRESVADWGYSEDPRANIFPTHEVTVTCATADQRMQCPMQFMTY